MSINKGPDKEDGDLYTMEYYSAMKKSKIVPFAEIWVDPEIVLLIEVSHKVKNIIY